MLCNKDVRSITQNTIQVAELNRILDASIPPKLAQFCAVTSYRNGVLTLETSTGSAATQLKFIEPKLLTKLKQTQQFQALMEIKIRMGSTQPSKLDRHYTRPAPEVSEHSRSLIRQTADIITDQPLAASLHKLADTLENYGKE